MGYCVRLLTSSEKVVPLGDILKQVSTVSLASGTETSWDKIEINQSGGSLIAELERYPLASGSQAESELRLVRESLKDCNPVNAREWLRRYLSGTRTIYIFRLLADNITPRSWPVLGVVQNLLKDNLGGIIQADNEGFYNEAGDYILWQMYPGASGTIPAAVLNDRGEWTSYQLRLDDSRAVELFKQGLPPPKGFLDRLRNGWK